MDAIIISGMAASGKTSVSKILAERLNVPLVGGGDILKEMAVERGYKPGGADWWDTPDGLKFLKERETNPDFDRETDRRLHEKIKKGNIVITSWSVPWLFQEGFKVWLNASSEARAECMAKRDNTDMKESKHVVGERDRENHKLYMELYHINLGKDTSPFQLVIETEKRTPEEIAGIIIKEHAKKV